MTPNSLTIKPFKWLGWTGHPGKTGSGSICDAMDSGIKGTGP